MLTFKASCKWFVQLVSNFQGLHKITFSTFWTPESNFTNFWTSRKYLVQLLFNFQGLQKLTFPTSLQLSGPLEGYFFIGPWQGPGNLMDHGLRPATFGLPESKSVNCCKTLRRLSSTFLQLSEPPASYLFNLFPTSRASWKLLFKVIHIQKVTFPTCL